MGLVTELPGVSLLVNGQCVSVRRSLQSVCAAVAVAVLDRNIEAVYNARMKPCVAGGRAHEHQLRRSPGPPMASLVSP